MYTYRRGVASRIVIVVALVAMLLSLLPAAVVADAGDIRNPDRTQPRAAGRPGPRPVPAEIEELFADGIPAQDFVEMAGYVPRALEGIVESEILVIIELEQDPAAVLYAEQRQASGPVIMRDIETYRESLDVAQEQVIHRASDVGLNVQEISRYNTVYNGIQALVPVSQIAEIAALPGVVAVHRAPIHEPALGSSVPLIGADDVWMDLGYDGEGVVIAIIDTGIDYTHAALGGSGDPNDYATNDPNVLEPATFPTDKVVGGYDFAGSDYDASGLVGSPVPNPDNDPLDEHGHGTHVASIAAGVMAGNVMTGTAPLAQLMALKVFGQDGSTALTIDALEWATISYMLTGYPQVINMSLGSSFGTDDPDDPSVVGSDNAAAAGIIVVASSGNAGDSSYITGSPGTASKVLSVAATTTGYVTGPTVDVIDTPYITQTNIIYHPGAFDGNTGTYTDTITAPLNYVGNLPGATDNQLCTTGALAANALVGQIALISRGTCAFAVKVNNAASLGAVGALIFNNAPGIITMAGDPVQIPAGSLQEDDGLNLIPAHGQMVVVSAQDDVTTVPDPYTPADSIATFSSRGPRGVDSFLKPEISAPGVGTFAADMGSGNGGVSMSGTSMAAPHVAGVAALVRQAKPDWTPEEVKALLMNTAVDLVDETPIPRSGSGRVDAYAAINTNAIAIADEDLVSLNWGVVTSNEDSAILTGDVAVRNLGTETLFYDVAAHFQLGSWSEGVVGLDVTPSNITVPAGESVAVTVTLELDLTVISSDYNTVEEYFGWVLFGPDTAPLSEDANVPLLMHGILRVPFYAQVKPFATLDVVADGEIEHPMHDIAVAELTHSGPITSSLWSMAALAAPDAPNPAMSGEGDIRMFGMDYGWNQPGYGEIFEVGFNTWEPWHVPQPFFAEFDLYIDADRDGSFDYVNFNFNYGWFTGASHNNQWVVVQVDLSTNMLDLGSPWIIYTDYNNGYMEWWLPAAWQGLGPGNTDFDYQLISFDVAEVPNVMAPGSFDYVDVPLYSAILNNNPGPASPNALALAVTGNMSGYHLADPVGLMIIDYMGDARNVEGAQAYLLPIDVTLDNIYILPLTMGNNASMIPR